MKTIRLAFAVALAVGLVSCAKFFKLKKEVKRLEESYYLTGQLNPSSKTTENVSVFVWEKHESDIITITDVGRLRPGGTFAFILPPSDRYHVAALEDANDNQRYDPGERHWVYGAPDPVTFTDRRSDVLQIKLSEKITIPEEDLLILRQARAGLSFLELKDGGQIPIVTGETASLGDPKFSVQMGEKGLWEPASFLNEV